MDLAYLDAKFTHFPDANCTEHEFRNAEETGCVVRLLPGGTDITNPDDVSAVIDRAGQRPAFSPEFAATVNLDYWIPFRGYKVDMGALVTGKTSYYTDFREFDKATIQDASVDLNMNLGIGDMEDKWRVGLSARNLLGPRGTFRPEYTSDISELAGGSLRSNEVKSIALTFKYNFFD